MVCQNCDEAWEAYQKVWKSAWEACEKVEKPAWEAYKKATSNCKDEEGR
jgi:hypothetical protein